MSSCCHFRFLVFNFNQPINYGAKLYSYLISDQAPNCPIAGQRKGPLHWLINIVPVFFSDIANEVLKMCDFIALHAGQKEKAHSRLVPTVQLLKIIATLQHCREKFAVAGKLVQLRHDGQVQLLHTCRPYSPRIVAKLDCSIGDGGDNANSAEYLCYFLQSQSLLPEQVN